MERLAAEQATWSWVLTQQGILDSSVEDWALMYWIQQEDKIENRHSWHWSKVKTSWTRETPGGGGNEEGDCKAEEEGEIANRHKIYECF